jgi:putative aldouronate transport system permease protein
MELRKLLFVNIGAEASDMDAADVEQIKKLVQVVKYCIIVLSSLPIMCLYPFLQKYFVQGVMIGSIKG